MSYMAEKNRKLEEEWNAFNQKIKNAQNGNTKETNIVSKSSDMNKSPNTSDNPKPSRNDETDSKNSRHNDRHSKDRKHDDERDRKKHRRSRSRSKERSREEHKSSSHHHHRHHSRDKKEHHRRNRSKSKSKSPDSHRHKSSRHEKSLSSTRRRDQNSRSRSRSTEKHSREKKPTEKIVESSVSKLEPKVDPVTKVESRPNPIELAKIQAEEIRKKTEEITGMKVPSFYSATAVNPLLYAEQERKRKLLWSKTKDNENTSTKIVGQAILENQDEKTAEKFRKLMGIKANKSSEQDESPAQKVNEINQMQKQAFDALDKEYEYARLTTHLNRGKGLGFASRGLPQ